MTSTGLICLAVVISVAIVCITLLFYFGKISIFSVSRENGIKISLPIKSHEVALEYQDELLDKSLEDFKRTLLFYARECFENNDTGRWYAVHIAALNHCLRDIKKDGYDNYVAEVSKKGKWTESETKCFMRGLLMASRKMILQRIDIYEKCMTFNVMDEFREITKQKHEKNIEYGKMVDGIIEKIEKKNG